MTLEESLALNQYYMNRMAVLEQSNVLLDFRLKKAQGQVSELEQRVTELEAPTEDSEPPTN